ncbi:trigger factor [Youngiibacter fragilis]|uniref:Trigger factor n=1 Tax=Youngiibacter fragilis 232.1 TaxID=994573 RepID=V7I4A2_9CLOT|nr:trigger factor [Youngiibacter fragilis]ETA79817.1 trigger factor [Youngiibacter fragilis 232.1]
MDVKLEKLSSSKVLLEVAVESKKFDEALQKAFKKNAGNFRVQGFRPGKAPFHMVKRFYGVEVLFDDASNALLNETYPQAVAQTEISPVGYPEIDITQIEEGKDFLYKATVDVYPEFEVAEYKGLSVAKPSYPADEAEVDKEIESLREKNARLVSKAEGSVIEDKDTAVIDFLGKVDGVEFEGGKGESFELEIGSGTFIDNFEEQLKGLKAGEEKVVTVTFPESYGVESLNGKAADFEVKVLDIKAKEYPEVDDEFASEVSEFETLAELRESIASKLMEAGKKKEESEYRNNLLAAVVEKTEIDIPQSMVETQVDRLVQDFEQRLAYQGVDKKMYMEMTGSNDNGLRDMFRENAQKIVKNDLVLSKIIEKEGLLATDEEVTAKAEEIAGQYGESKEKFMEILLGSNRPDLEMEIKTDKAFALLEALAAKDAE